MLFADRLDAGRRLAARLQHLRGQELVVLGLPRGGVPVAAEVARALDAPLDVIIVRKLGVPFQPELGMGAIGEGGVRVINDEVLRTARITPAELARVEARERSELERRARRFRAGRPRASLHGRVAVIVDDGIATASTAKVACQVARALGPQRVVLAVPVAPPGWEERIGRDADECIALATPEGFYGIGEFYADFAQTSDDEVIACLARAAERSAVMAHAPRQPDPPMVDEDVELDAGGVRLHGHLTIPQTASGVVVFAHGSGSSRHSPRNRYVAAVLNEAGLGTLLFDLLTPLEEHDRGMVFDIDLLARRLVAATRWLQAQPEATGLPVGWFGASTGAGAALWAAAHHHVDHVDHVDDADQADDVHVAAVVSRGGRPDLAGSRLRTVSAPTLLIVGGHDEAVLALNRHASSRLHCEHELAVVPGATHLFEEPGTLQEAAELARDWFVEHLVSDRQPQRGSVTV